MKTLWLILLSLFMVTGCANLAAHKIAHQAGETPPHHPRVVYRDLTTPKLDPVSGMPVSGLVQANANRPVCSIEFQNDSHTGFNMNDADAFIDRTPPDALVVVFGHSHGKSAVGTRNLATKRAETIAGYLREMGFTNVHVMASWGGNSVPFCPSRGVQIYALEPGREGDFVQFAFSRTTEERVAENEKSPDDYDAVNWDNTHASAQNSLADD